MDPDRAEYGAKKETNGHIAGRMIVGIILLMLIVAVYSNLHFYTCKKCRRRGALLKTDSTKVGTRKWGGDDCVMYEYKCRHCGDLTWHEKPERRSWAD